MLIAEVFHSIQGEAATVGWPTVFIRLTGCPLRCRYCDTAYAFSGGQWRDVDQLLEETASHGARHVCVTGGEPLAQRNCTGLLTALCDAGYDVSLETSGAYDISVVDSRVRRVVDLKTPASGEMHRNRLENLALLCARDQLKFVICNRDDFDWMKAMLAEHAPQRRCDVLVSPSWGELEPGQLADWLLADQLPVRFQLQLHKVLWGDVPGR
ncbi:MAG: 7-carboxy-7-deazaguanine synthase QueE [Gammaproteobacteria bacterium]|nr:7-carboxy-7-deazaguanine synthase QueE [Gammaproteobacteria bacterium]TVQ45314.1 MAG: 7-carboxy-7-deazaguanine synthase QueE [Gammaproteobacteria bacterium]